MMHAGNNNGLLDYGESVMMTISIKNIGTANANGVNAVLSSTDPYVTITDNSATYGSIAAGATVSVPNGFAISIANNIPDGHSILFSMQLTEAKATWTVSFNDVAHAPVLGYSSYIISDPTGNNNGKLDPGETVNFIITAGNSGSSSAYNVIGQLVCSDPYITINTNNQNFGTITGGGTKTANYSVTASASTPAGYVSNFTINLSGNLGITGSGNFSTIVGQIPVLIIDLDVTKNSGPAMQAKIQALGIGVDYVTVFPASVNLYASVFLCLGIYPNNTVLSASQGTLLASYLNGGGKLYMEGGDTWAYDATTAVHSMFRITGVADGSADMGTIVGQTGTFTQGQTFTYSGENS